MTKKDFFRMLIKLLGIYMLFNIWFSALPFSFYRVFDFEDSVGVFGVLGGLLVETALFLFLILKTDLIVKWLKLDKGYDADRVETNSLSGENLLKLGIIIVGGLLVVENLPPVLSNIFVAFQSSVGKETSNSVSQTQPTLHIVIQIVKLTIGYFLLTRYMDISRLLKGKDKNDSVE